MSVASRRARRCLRLALLVLPAVPAVPAETAPPASTVAAGQKVTARRGSHQAGRELARRGPVHDCADAKFLGDRTLTRFRWPPS